MVAAFRDAGFETCADLCAVDYLTHPGRSLPDGVDGRALRGRGQPALALHAPARAHPGAGARVRPDGRQPVRRLPGHRRHGARGLRHDRHPLRGPPRHDPDPHARGLGGPPAAQGLRRRAGCRCSSRKRRDPDERARARARARAEHGTTGTSTSSTPSTRRATRPRSSALVAETSEGAQELLPRGTTSRRRAPPGGGRRPAPARGRLRRPRRHRHRAPRRRDDDHQHGSAAPLDPRGAAPHARARRRDGAAHQADHRLPAHRHGEDRGRSSPTSRAPPT